MRFAHGPFRGSGRLRICLDTSVIGCGPAGRDTTVFAADGGEYEPAQLLLLHGAA